eukprot:CAMPEP_0184350802 /NCGR_PEP_ID=MMETSP1089-20130417/42011_1 /TAXON_ID=38269 ORGANISM="Gloeochaete wittrockiana, Strain SAG46.84" /NCGR_SAMPLE_ID=MMETSP1089 /ASSEMBLY_ACC=CAM_ASM_000445 /LENGTH=165 /DNA_ID=CAMNT_0026683851 /DNA_START=30 /DNA_END=527 /DNA_ORIENTATION=+
MDLDEFDLEETSRVPSRASTRDLRPRSQMFEEPLHIEPEDDMGSSYGGFDNRSSEYGYPGGQGYGDYSSVPGHSAPPGGMPVFVPGESSNFNVSGSSKMSRATTCCIFLFFILILILVAVILILCAIIIWKVFEIDNHLEELTFKIKVPTNPPPVPRPPQLSGGN